MVDLAKLFENMRELAFRQMKFEKLSEKEQKKELGAGGIYPEWNEDACAEYLNGDARYVSFWESTDRGASQLSETQQAIISAMYTKAVFDGWRVDDVKLEADSDNEYIDLIVIITSKE